METETVEQTRDTPLPGGYLPVPPQSRTQRPWDFLYDTRLPAGEDNPEDEDVKGSADEDEAARKWLDEDVSKLARRRRAAARKEMHDNPDLYAAAAEAKAAVGRRRMYGSDLSAYDFERELCEAREREALRARFRHCWTVEATARADEFDAAAVRLLAAPAPPHATLLQHARRFGVAEVYELASGDALSLDRLRKELQEIARDRVKGEWLKRAVTMRQAGRSEKQVLTDLGFAHESEQERAERVKLLRRTLRSLAKAVTNGSGRISRAELAVALRARGLTTVEIGAELKISARHAQRLLREHDRKA